MRNCEARCMNSIMRSFSTRSQIRGPTPSPRASGRRKYADNLAVALVSFLLLACSRSSDEQAPSPAVGWGSVMADIGRRFEQLGRAATVGRFELAEYQLGEIEEQFEDALPHATPPREGHPDVLPPMSAAFLQTTVPDLKRAMSSRNVAGFRAAFARAAGACNECHQASGHGFIEIPTVPGQSVPSTEPPTERPP